MKEFSEMAGYKIETVKCMALLSAGDEQGNAVHHQDHRVRVDAENTEFQRRANEGHPRVLRQKFKCH